MINTKRIVIVFSIILALHALVYTNEKVSEKYEVKDPSYWLSINDSIPESEKAIIFNELEQRQEELDSHYNTIKKSALVTSFIFLTSLVTFFVYKKRTSES